MRPIGAARRGDVVFVQQVEPYSHLREVDAVTSAIVGLYEQTGVQIVVLPPNLRPAALAPSRQLRARYGPTPRWCQR